VSAGPIESPAPIQAAAPAVTEPSPAPAADQPASPAIVAAGVMTQTAQADPVPTPQPAATVPEASGRYSVIVGSFRQNAEAAVLVDQLRALGYRARLGRVESADRGTWHQVSVGPYAELEQARQDEARVRQLPGYADAHLITQ